MRRRHLPSMMILIAALAALIWGTDPCFAGPGGGTYYANSPAGGVTGTALRKFVDSLPGLGFANRNNLGQYIPVAIPDTTAYAGSDYYEIGLKEYTQSMHSDLPKATRLRGYFQINTADSTVRNVNQYLGPLIIAKRDRPVRVKFVNLLPTGTAGNLFIPVDTSLMGAGTGPDAVPGTNCNTIPKPVSCYSENRATIHLHGGNSPWISDGTPHQWTVPAGEPSLYKKGVSTRDVPDMPASGDGEMMFYWPNQQSGRLMFYHDHAYGITRLNVYAGEAAGYLLVDPEEDVMINSGVLPNLGGVYRYGIPLVIQDKTFVPANVVSKPATTGVPAVVGQDDRWDLTKWGQPGDLWFPHVYEANQDPFSPDGSNPFGRWDYGPWFWPPVNVDPAHAVLPDPSTTPEAFGDTPLVNGTAYPYLQVQPRVYRFRILNASNDRALNLQLYYADPADPTGKEVKMVPAAANPTYPPDWPTDGRAGGVPDPATVGPNMIQIGTEGGLLPNPVVIPNRPVGFDYNRRNIVVLNILNRALMLGPAERADVIIDFSSVPAGSKLILYNDSPAPTPAFDPRYDYYTANPDQSTSGGAPSTLVGYGPNTRTIMQFQVAGTPSAPFNLGALQTALPVAFKASQPTPIVPETVYNSVYPTTPVTNDLYSKISDYSFTFTRIGETIPSTIQFRPKAIQELWDPYGRMNATLGVELPFTNAITQTTIPLGYAEPPTEFVYDAQPQIWKITHNGVDSHPVHFHLFSVQVINRVGWDGAIRVPENNELGWKETVMMNPLEDVIVALQPYRQTLPFALPISMRLLDPTQPPGTPIATTSLTAPPVAITIPNAVIDYGFEYVWHCHILGHEENDFMRPLVFRVPTAVPGAPTGLTAILGGQTANGITNPSVNEVILTWMDNAGNEATFRIERAPVTGGVIGAYAPLGTISLLPSSTPAFTDATVSSNTDYSYRVFAFNSLGDSIPSYIEPVPTTTTTPTWSPATSLTITPSKPSPHIEGTNVIFTALATGPTPSVVYHYRFTLTSGGTSTVVQDYSTKTMWALPATAAPGAYTITVDVLSSIATPLPVPDMTTSLPYEIVVPVAPIGAFSPVPGTYTQAVSGPSVTVTLSANVPANIFYTMNGTTPNTLSTRYTGPIGLTTSTTISFIAVDASGSSSVVNTATYIVHVPDLTATVLINSGAVSTNTTAVTLTLAASDPTGVATMQFSNDDITYSAEELFATTKSWDLSLGLATPLTDGPRTVYVRFRDNSLPLPGTLYSPVTATIIMDRVAPVTTALPAAGVYAATPTPFFVTLASNEPGTTYYTIDGTIPTTASNVYLTPILVSAQTTIKYFSVDLAGNPEPVINTGTWSFDTGSTITGSIGLNSGLTTTNTQTVTLSLLANYPAGAIVQMQFSNDGLTWSAPVAYAMIYDWVLPTGDGIKTVYARFQDNLGLWSSPFTMTIALITGAPVTTASPIPGIYSAAPVFVTLTANNALSKIYYTTDLSAPTTASQVYTGPIALNATTTINYFSVDIAGNTEAYQTGTWTISAGNMAASVGINNGSLFTNNTAVMLALSAVGPAGVNTMQFSNDGQTYTAEEAYAGSKAWTLLPGEGLKTVYVRFRDNSLPAPGVLSAPVTANITLDTTPPVTQAGPIPGTYSAPPIFVTLAANEATTIYYTTDGTTPTMASTVYTGPISVSATTTIKYFAVDLAGNAEALVNTGTWTINTVLSITAGMQINNGASVTSNPAVTLSLLASAPATTIAFMQFSNDGINYSAEEPFAPTKPWLLSAGDGNKTVYVRFKDTSNPPILYWPVSTSITLDTTPPVTQAGPIPGSYSATPVIITLTANEPATIFYTLDGTTPTTASAFYMGPISIAVTTTLKYFAVDAAGNTEVIKSATWTILGEDLVASAQINDGSARTNNSSVVLHLSAVDPVGVAAMQFSNDGMNYTAEEAYAATKAWTLTSGDGIKTVYVRFRDNTLPTGYLYTPVTASVFLDTTAPVTSAGPAAGGYAAFPVMVTLSANEPATIYFTTDGTTPNTGSTVYTGAISVSANTTIKYFAVDLVGNVETVKSGTWSLVTGNDITASIVINSGLSSTNTPTVTLSLLANNPNGTIVQMQFSNDGLTWSGPETYAISKSWVLPPGDGIKTVYARFQDNLGLWSPPFTVTIALITGAPVTAASPIPGIYSAAPVFVTLTANNALSKIYYTTDLSTPTTASQVYTGPIALNATTTINYFSVDIAGNSEAYKTGTWTISAGNMTASVGINNGALFTNNTAVMLALSAVDPAGVKTMQFSNDGVVYTAEEAYAATKAWTLLPGEGLKTVYVRYRDNSLPAPGFLHTPVTANITLDTTPPVTQAGPIPATYSSPPLSVNLVANEAATIYYTIDGTVPTAASTVYTGPITLAATTTIKYFAVDIAGNAEAVKTGTWTISTGIITAGMLINNGASVTGSPTVTLSLLASVPTATIAFMRFSNDGINYSAEEAFFPTKVWLLSAGDGNKTVYVRFKDTSNPPILYSPVSTNIRLDTIAPVTTAGPIPGAYSATPVSITLTANEPATIYYTTDGTTPTTASAVYAGALSTAVTTTIRYFAVDAAGNTEGIKSATWTILGEDLVAGAQINNGSARTNNSSVLLHLSAVDPVGVATMQFSNDGMNYTAEEAYAATKAWTLTSGDGIKTVYVRFRDNSLPTGYLYTPVMASVFLDTTAPVTSAGPVTGDYAAAPVMVTLNANEPATIYYTVDGTTPTTGSTVYTGAIPVSANTTIKYFAVDLAGNAETVKSGTWTIRSSNMTAGVKINNGAVFATGTAVTLSILATDPAGAPVSMQFSNDGVSFTAEEPFAISRPWTLSSGDGLKTVYVRIRDASLGGGFLHPPVTSTITLDSTAPITTASPITGVYSNAPVSVTLSSTETATIYYTTNGSTPSTGSTKYTGPISVAATTTIKYFGVDPAGNSEAYKTGIWTIHAADLTASVVINNAAPRTHNGAVVLTLSAIDPAGIATMQFSNDGTNYTVEEPYATSKAWVLSPGDGIKTVYVRFRDKTLPTGVLYSPVTSNITLDTIAPVTTAGPIPGAYSTTPLSITLTANEPATIYYTTDGATPTTASSVYAGALSTAVTTTIRYFAVDTAGNTEGIKSATWTILSLDLVARAQINNGSARTNNRSVVLYLSAVDPVGVSTMQFSDDGLSYTAEEAYAATKAWTLTSGDGIKTVYVRFRDNSLPTGYLYTPVTASVFLDTTAPVTSAGPVTGDYAAAPVMVTLSANEPATIHFTTDGTTPTTGSTVYTGAIPVSANTTIKYFAVDQAGNVETVKSGTWTIRSSTMTASVKINNGAVFTAGTAVTLSILATDPAGAPVSMQFSNDGVTYLAEEPFATSRAWTLSSGDGLKTVYVKIRDAALGGGFLHPPVTSTITLDSTAPITTASPITGVYSNAPVSVTLSSTETATIYYTTNGSTPTTASTRYTGPISVAATTTIKYFGVDLAGNSEAYKTGTWTIHAADLTASVVINNAAPRTNNGAVALTLSAIDPAGIATMQFSNDGTNYTVEEPYATSKAWVLSPGDGLKTVYVRFRDKTLPAGFLYPPVTSDITLDTIAPYTTASPITGSYAVTPVAVTLTADEPATIYYTTNGTAPTTGSSVYTGPISVAAATTIKYFAIDAAGNREPLIKSGTWTFDTEPDMTARILINSGALWTTTTNVVLTLSATDPNGLKTMQFSNNGITFTAEEPYATSKAWTLTFGDGTKTVYVRFRDNSLPDGLLHSPVHATIALDTSAMRGDVNDDGQVNLMDLILALQVISRNMPAATINNHSAISGAGKIGLQEAIYIMQKIAGMR